MMNKTKKKNDFQKSNSYQDNKKPNFSNDNVSTDNNYSETFKEISNSKENVELSLEVEIADSLKKLLSQPENCNSRLLDVTIIRPSKDSTAVNRVETNTIAFGKDDIKDLLTIIERQEHEESVEKHKQQHKCCRHAPSESTKPKFEIKSTKKTTGVRSAPPNLNPLKRNSAYQSHLRNVEARLIEICNNRISLENIEESNDTSESSDYHPNKRDTSIGDGSNAHHIYATANTFDSLKKALECQNKKCKDGEKPDTPCLCQHCGTLGLLVESQKGPVLAAANSPLWNSTRKNENKTSPHNQQKRGRYIDLRTKNKPNDLYLQNISARLKKIEERLATQEERSVNKEYFKTIVGKLITYCQHKLNQQELPHQSDVRDNSAQCTFNETKNYKKDLKLNTYIKQKQLYKENQKNYCINPLLINQEMNQNDDSNISNETVSENKSIMLSKTFDNFWKWGEEVIKPGFDLKTKILSLLDEKLTNSSQKTENNFENIKKRTDNKNEEHNRNNIQVKVSNQNCRCSLIENSKKRDIKKDTNCGKRKLAFLRSSSTTSIANALNSSVQQPIKENNTRMRKIRSPPTKGSQITLTTSQYEPIFMKHHDKVDKLTTTMNKIPLHISYVNPTVKDWKNDSTTSFTKTKLKNHSPQTERANVQKRCKTRLNIQDSLQAKLDCLRQLAKTKNIDECVLWRNIWNKVKSHARTKYDTVTIQIPTETIYKLQKDDNQIKEIDLTLTDLFDIVVKSKENSKISLDVDTSSVSNNRKRLEEIHKQLGIILNKQLSKN